VSHYVELLDRVLTLLDEGYVSDAVELMNSLNTNLSLLEKEASNIVMFKNLVKYGSAALVLTIPIITYVALPRLYLLLWFKSRRRWVVINERNKR